MSDYQLKATILLFLDSHNINFMNELRHQLKLANRLDLVVLLDEDSNFSDRIKNYLFKKRLGVLSNVE